MSDIQELEHRVRAGNSDGLQEDLIGSPNDTIAKMQQALDLQLKPAAAAVPTDAGTKAQMANANRTACATRFRRIIDKLKRACWIHALFFYSKRPSESQSAFRRPFNNPALQTSQFVGHLLLDGFTLADKFVSASVNQYFRRTVARVVVARHA